MWSYIYDHTNMTLLKNPRYSHMTTIWAGNSHLFRFYDQQFGRIYMSKAICDHHMTNVLLPICPIHHLTIIWPTHFWSKHMTNHTTKIVISTNLIICSGLKLNANDLFYYLFVSRICHRPPLLTPLIQVHPPPPLRWCSRFTLPLLFRQLLPPFSSPLH